MFSCLRGILVCLFLFSCASTQEKEGRLLSANAHLELALSYISQDDLPAALDQLQKSKRILADNADLDHTYALYYQKAEDPDRAEFFFTSALSKKPTHPRFNNNYGVLLSQEGRYERAYKHFQIAYNDKEYPQRSGAYENYGDAALLDQDYERAIMAYEQALTLTPDWFILRVKLAKSHFNQADFELAYGYFSAYMDNLRSLNLSPSAEDLELGIGIAAVLKDFEAVENYQELLINLEQ